jgi:hypothetical protein
MCEKCIELDKQIERYRRLAAGINDQLVIAELNAAIKQAQKQKDALHPASAEPHA